VLHQLKYWKPAVHEIARVSKQFVLSVVEGTEAKKNPRRQYMELRREFGYPLDRFEEGEEGLRQYAKPMRVLTVWETEEEADAKETIDYLQKKQSSVTWGLPQEIHNKIIQKLSEQFGGTLIKRKSRIELATWQAHSLLNV
jgi:hypothetical protein